MTKERDPDKLLGKKNRIYILRMLSVGDRCTKSSGKRLKCDFCPNRKRETTRRLDIQIHTIV